ncbi:YcgL domain-containing protein [Pseudaeromonas paramecii]|uniref:YcgL domain-containing protein GCM10023095_01830 n=1 Tax=Pseudaeromonas paramecii TaxID=2138166 RepID=A0ABP8PUS9_9GAMM
MICAVYKSRKKEQTYLYVERRDDFSRVPAELMTLFGSPQFVMLLPLAKHAKLPGVDPQALADALAKQGFFLQLPPPAESLLVQHRRTLNLEPHTK